MDFKQFVQQEDHPYKVFVREAQKVCEDKNLMMQTIGSVGEYDLYSIIANPKAPVTIGFSGTIHGDETAGVCSILDFFKQVTIPKDVRVFAIPLMNPVGFNTGRHTGIDHLNLNRLFTFKNSKHETALVKKALVNQKLKFFHNIHEDDEAHGFYLYFLNESILPQCRAILDIASEYFPIDDRKNIYGDKVVEKGLIHTHPVHMNKDDYGCLETWLHRRGVNNICTETPREADIATRVECEVAIMKYVIETFK